MIYNRLLTNLGIPATNEEPIPFREMLPDIRVKKARPAELQGYFLVDLIPHCNQVFGGPHRKAGSSPTFHLTRIPSGKVLFEGIPFFVLDSGTVAARLAIGAESAKTCIVLKGKDWPDAPQAVVGISVYRKVKTLYFLHAATWVDFPAGTELGAYRIHYQDGSSVDYPLRNMKNIGDWYLGGSAPPSEAKVAWKERDRGLFMAAWPNPKPETQISTIDFVSSGEATLVLLAITAELAE